MQQLPADTYQLASAHRFGPPKEVEESISTYLEMCILLAFGNRIWLKRAGTKVTCSANQSS